MRNIHTHTSPRRVALLCGTVVAIVACAVIFLSARGRVRRSDYLNRFGFLKLMEVARPYTAGVTSTATFDAFFDSVNAARPDAVSQRDAPNPFPGFLPAERTYVRMLELPASADPERTPFMWAASEGRRGVEGVFWTGRLFPHAGFTLADVDRRLAEVSQRTGEQPLVEGDRGNISTGGCPQSTEP